MTTKREARRLRAEQQKVNLERDERRRVRSKRLVIGGCVILLAVLIFASVRRKPPEGKVWSAEHGHWHDR